MAANKHRGEVSVRLGDTDLVARPSYTAVCAWEEALGRPSTELAVRLSSGLFTAREVATVLHAALKAGGSSLSLADVGEAIVEEGLADYLRPAVLLLRNALTGGREPASGEAPAAETEPSPTAA